MIRKLVLLMSLVVIVGCGFKLRGTIPWPSEYQSVYMEGYNPTDRNSFFYSVKNFFPDHVNIVSNGQDADAIIRVLSETQTTRTISALAANRDTEEVVTLTIVAQVVEKNGKSILPPTTLMRERDFTYDESNLLGKSTDIQNVTRQLRQDLAAMFMRRLEAALRNQEEATEQ